MKKGPWPDVESNAKLPPPSVAMSDAGPADACPASANTPVAGNATNSTRNECWPEFWLRAIV
jgi:hypothetical protein